MIHMMLDLETLGVLPGCPIISIGAVMFNIETNTLGQQFYVPIHEEQIGWGLHAEEATLEWWKTQSEEARRVFTDPKRMYLPEALALFIVWAKGQPNDFCLWANGADFDPPILRRALANVEYPCPWDFWNVRCYRTIKNLRPDIKMKKFGEAHHALADATAQAVHLMDIFAQMEITIS